MGTTWACIISENFFDKGIEFSHLHNTGLGPTIYGNNFFNLFSYRSNIFRALRKIIQYNCRRLTLLITRERRKHQRACENCCKINAQDSGDNHFGFPFVPLSSIYQPLNQVRLQSTAAFQNTLLISDGLDLGIPSSSYALQQEVPRIYIQHPLPVSVRDTRKQPVYTVS